MDDVQPSCKFAKTRRSIRISISPVHIILTSHTLLRIHWASFWIGLFSISCFFLFRRRWFNENPIVTSCKFDNFSNSLLNSHLNLTCWYHSFFSGYIRIQLCRACISRGVRGCECAWVGPYWPCGSLSLCPRGVECELTLWSESIHERGGRWLHGEWRQEHLVWSSRRRPIAISSLAAWWRRTLSIRIGKKASLAIAF